MIDSVMLWNGGVPARGDAAGGAAWAGFAEMAALAGDAIAAESPSLPRVLGGLSAVEPERITELADDGVLDHVDAIAVRGVPRWGRRPLTALPVWISEVGVAASADEHAQARGLRHAAALVAGAPRVHWRGLFDGRDYLGLIRDDGSARPAARQFAELGGALGVCQWFDFEDDRLDDAVRWLERIEVRQLRTGLSWADAIRPGADAWFDRQMRALEAFDVTVTFCSTPDHRGVEPHPTGAPREPEEFAELCARIVRRYAS